jgi:pimeloyl-ACP methyl ester carboxylesterase
MITTRDTMIPIQRGQVFSRTWEQADFDLAPIIMLHDSLGSVDLWGSFPINLAETTGRTVIAYDRLGFGRSSAREELPSVNFIREEAGVYFPEIKNSLGVMDFCLFGHSVGGGMAITIASQFQKECTAVVTESAQAFVEELTIKGVQTAKDKFKDPAALDKLKKLHGEKAKWVLDAWIEVWLSPSFADWNLRNELKKVLCPILIIHGEHDEYGSRAFPDLIHKLAAEESQLELIADCGHLPHREKRDLVLSLTKSFLATKA